MKPVKLIIEGINSFDARQELDFEAVGRSNLFCICGKTGAGKTTIFDSMMLALYGRCGKGNLADVVNLSRMNAFVSLEFTEGNDRYIAERTIKCRRDGEERRKATSECTLYKNGEPIAKGEDAAAVISEVIGLDLSEFKNVYMLEQGEYAEFLKKQPAKQTEAVGKIFSLMRFGDIYKLAAERRRDEETKASSAEARLEDLGDISQETIRALKSELSSLRAKNAVLVKDIESAREKLDGMEKARLEFVTAEEKMRAVREHTARLEEARKKHAQACARRDEFLKESGDSEERQKEIEELRAKINELSALNAIDKEYAAAASAAEEKLRAATAKRDGYEKMRDGFNGLVAEGERIDGELNGAISAFCAAVASLKAPSRAASGAADAVGKAAGRARQAAVADAIYALREEKSAFDALVGERESAEQERAHAAERCEQLLDKTQKYGEALSRADEAAAAAKRDESEKQAELERAKLASHAAAVAAELKAGDVCPVCGGVFDGKTHVERGSVERRKAEYEKAKAAREKADAEATELRRLIDAAKSDYARASADRDAAEKKSGKINESIEKTGVEPSVYTDMARALGEAKKLCEAYAAAAEKRASAEPALKAAEAESAAAAAAAESEKKRADELLKSLDGGELCGKTEGLIDSAKAAESALEKKESELNRKKAELESEVSAAQSAIDVIKSTLDDAVKACPPDMPQFDEDEYAEKKRIYDCLVKEHTERDKDIAIKTAEQAALTDRAERAKNIKAERDLHTKKADNYGRIADMTKGKAMLNYVAAEYIESFTAVASDILGELSSGKYSMSYDAVDGFVVADYLNDAKKRKTDTLSGGELFLASLSVAIAIARAVGSGKNAFFFLDEGFGTLDEELIDTVYGALDALSQDCLVGVISHATALIDRMPSCVEVIEASDTCGSRIKY